MPRRTVGDEEASATTNVTDIERLRQDAEQEQPQDEDEEEIKNISAESFQQHRVTRCECCCRLLVFSVLISCVALVVVDLTTTKYIPSAAVQFVAWLGEHPVEGIFAVIGLFALGNVLFIPANALTIAVGFAFRSAFAAYHKSVVLASIAVLFGTTIGSILSFLLGRYLLRGPVLSMASHYPLFRAIDRALGQKGLRIMFLLRLSPLIPYNILDYLSGVTAIPLWKFTVALIGMLPGIILFCAIGAAASSLAAGNEVVQENRAIRIGAICAGLVFTFGGVALASYYSKLELAHILREQNRREDGGIGLPNNSESSFFYGLEIEMCDQESMLSLTSSAKSTKR